MTINISQKSIPNTYLKTLVRSAKDSIDKTKDSFIMIRVPDDIGNFYVMWAGLDENDELIDYYFYTDDIVKYPSFNRSPVFPKS